MDIERKHIVLVATCFYRGSEKLILLMQRIIFGGQIFKKSCNLHFLGVCAKNLSDARRIFSGRIVKTAFSDSRGTRWVYAFSEEIISSMFFFGFWLKKHCNFTKQFSVGLWKLPFFVFRGTFSMRKVFFIEFIKSDSCSGYE